MFPSLMGVFIISLLLWLANQFEFGTSEIEKILITVVPMMIASAKEATVKDFIKGVITS